MAQPTQIRKVAAPMIGESGTSLVEALLTMVLIAFVLLSIAQLIGTSVLVHKVSEDLTDATALAEHKLEELRNLDYAAISAGGSITADVANFFDNQDIDGDGTVDYVRRWQVADNGVSKNITVFVESLIRTSGPAKSSTLFALVAQP